jgi:DNA mismatch endonuclease (patch repair protein)
LERSLRKTLINGRFEGTTSQRSRIMRAIKGKNNRSTELRFRLALVRAGVRGWTVRPKNILGNPDFWFQRRAVAIFVDGCFWHGCRKCGRKPKSNVRFWLAKFAQNRKKDRDINRRLASSGVKVLRLWEHDLKNDLGACIDRVAHSVKRQKIQLKSG